MTHIVTRQKKRLVQRATSTDGTFSLPGAPGVLIESGTCSHSLRILIDPTI